MQLRFHLRWIASMAVIGMVVFVAPSAGLLGQQTDAKKAAAQKKMALDLVKRQEAQGLQAVYVLLASANDNYGGHQTKAIHEVEAALKLLEGKAAKQLQPAVKAHQSAHKHVTAILGGTASAADSPEMQAISDAQVNHASALLAQLAEVMTANKQKRPLKHVEKAIKELAAVPKHATADVALQIHPATASLAAEQDTQQLIYFPRDFLPDRVGRFFSNGVSVSSTGRTRQIFSLVSTSSRLSS